MNNEKVEYASTPDHRNKDINNKNDRISKLQNEINDLEKAMKRSPKAK